MAWSWRHCAVVRSEATQTMLLLVLVVVLLLSGLERGKRGVSTELCGTSLGASRAVPGVFDSVLSASGAASKMPE